MKELLKGAMKEFDRTTVRNTASPRKYNAILQF